MERRSGVELLRASPRTGHTLRIRQRYRRRWLPSFVLSNNELNNKLIFKMYETTICAATH